MRQYASFRKVSWGLQPGKRRAAEWNNIFFQIALYLARLLKYVNVTWVSWTCCCVGVMLIFQAFPLSQNILRV